jgi:acyl-CoA synthetase (NDP forming)
VNDIQSETRLMFEHDAYRLLQKYNIPVPSHRLVHSEEEAVAAARIIGFPVVMKIVSKDVIHKSNIGGVILNISNEDATREAFKKITLSARNVNATVYGILVSEMICDGIETIIGFSVDPEFGQYIIFGTGGTLVELFDDTSLRLLPFSRKEALSMIKEVKGAKLLSGYRGDTPKDIEALVEILIRLEELIKKEPVTEIDLNPVIVMEKGVVVADARVFINVRKEN